MAIIKYPHASHLNGTGKGGLVDQHSAVIDALHIAIGAVIEATPHGRDWQDSHLGLEEYANAREASRERVLALEAIREDVKAGLIHIIYGD